MPSKWGDLSGRHTGRAEDQNFSFARDSRNKPPRTHCIYANVIQGSHSRCWLAHRPVWKTLNIIGFDTHLRHIHTFSTTYAGCVDACISLQQSVIIWLGYVLHKAYFTYSERGARMDYTLHRQQGDNLVDQQNDSWLGNSSVLCSP